MNRRFESTPSKSISAIGINAIFRALSELFAAETEANPDKFIRIDRTSPRGRNVTRAFTCIAPEFRHISDVNSSEMHSAKENPFTTMSIYFHEYRLEGE